MHVMMIMRQDGDDGVWATDVWKSDEGGDKGGEW